MKGHEILIIECGCGGTVYAPVLGTGFSEKGNYEFKSHHPYFFKINKKLFKNN